MSQSNDDAPSIFVDQSTIDAIVNQVVLNINKSVDQEFKEVKRQLDKAKVDNRVFLQSKGKQNQHANQLEIEDKIDEALANIKAGKIERATECLKQGKVIIHKRKKLIRIADMEVWATANEFRDDDLASDFEEDKKLRRALIIRRNPGRRPCTRVVLKQLRQNIQNPGK